MSRSLTLMTNLCLAWTTSKIQSVLQTSSFGNNITWLKAVSPAHFRNINLKGTFAFPVDQYRERLARVIATAEYVWDDAVEARRYLTTPHAHLGGQTPVEVALSEFGARWVEELLWKLYYGLAA